MQPKMCTKCKKNIAVVFITKIENGVTLNEGYCLKCARSLGVPQIEQAVKQMGFSDEDLDNLSDEMADVLWVLVCLANQTGVDLEKAIELNFKKKTLRDKERHIANNKL